MIEAHNSLIAARGIVTKKMIGIMLLACLYALAVPAGWAQQKTSSSTSTPAAGGPQASIVSSDQYLIGPGDQLSIGIFGKALLSGDQRVDERGMIRMPLIEEDIRASCRTENELAEEIARMYRDRDLLKNPAVTVSVKDFQSQPVAVMGSVTSPGRFILHRQVRLLELLIFHAGGPNATAGRKVQIISTMPGVSCEGSANQTVAVNATTANSATMANAGNSLVTYDLREVREGKTNPYVHQGDIIIVPAAEEAIIIGNVSRPATIPLLEPTTLGRAIAVVGGTLPNSKKDKILVKRQIPGSTATTEFLVDLKDKDKSKGEGFLLEGGDIVEVSSKTGMSAFLGNFAKTIVPTLTNLPLRVIY